MFGQASHGAKPGGLASGDFDVNTVKFGINYRFRWMQINGATRGGERTSSTNVRF